MHIITARCATQVSGTAAAFEPALETPAGAGDAARAHRTLDAAVHAVSQRLRQLQGLSLAVLATQACGPAARHTAAFPPQPHPLLLGDGAAAAAAAAADVLPRCVEPCTLLVRCCGGGVRVRWSHTKADAPRRHNSPGIVAVSYTCPFSHRHPGQRTNAPGWLEHHLPNTGSV